MNNLLAKYDIELKRNPVRTKALVGCILSAVANAMGQYRSSPESPINRKTVALFALRGTPPWSHWWFNWLDGAFPGMPVLVRLALDQFLWRPFLVLYSFVAMGVLQGHSWQSIKETLQSKLVATSVNSLKFGVIAQTLNLKLVPLRYRTTFWEVASLFWNFYLTLQMRRAEEKKKKENKKSDCLGA